MAKSGRKLANNDMVLKRREQVAALYSKGIPQWEIALQLGVTQQQISNDLKRIREIWTNNIARDFGFIQHGELEKLRMMEREAWEAWERSKRDAEITKVSTDGDGKKTASKTTKGQTGDAKYLDVIRSCIEQRCRILGLNAPTKIAPTDPGGQSGLLDKAIADFVAGLAAAQSPVVDQQYIDAAIVEHAQRLPGPQSVEDEQTPVDGYASCDGVYVGSDEEWGNDEQGGGA